MTVTPWTAIDSLEALAATGTVLWQWCAQSQQLRLHGPAASLGLEALSPMCPGAAFLAFLDPSDAQRGEEFIRTKEEGTVATLRARSRQGQAVIWRGLWLEDGLRAAGVAQLETAIVRTGVDELTGLLDRKSFLKRAQEVLSQPGTYDLVVADLDRFRRLNEALGHGRADLVLTALGARLGSAFTAESLPARLGEDEFAVLARKEGVRISERLRTALEQPLRIAGFDIHPSLSLGAVSAEGGENAPDAAELLRRAELAVESAKSVGRGGVAAYGRALESDGLTKLALEADLRGAFARGEIEPYYQPIVRLETGAVAGFEALVRWNHPRKGLIMPGDFLSLIEDMGMMNELGMLMMTKASHTFSRWLKHHPSPDGMFVSVNLSAGEIERYHLVEDVSRIIQESGLPRGALKLEVTESDIMRNPDQAALTLKALREVGAALAIDDFGTGFSSLSYLARLPFDTLKIDRYFVRTMETEENSAKIVRSVIALGRDLSLEVVAEGVENKAMAEQLLSVGCHFGQGFGYAPALSTIDAEVYLTESLLDGMAPIKTMA